MNIIERIEPVKNHKKRIHLSDGVDFILYSSEIRRFGLTEEMELPDALYLQILEEVWIPRAKRRVLHLLERMDRSEEQLRRKLAEGGYPEEAIEEAIAYAASYHYVDDERMARSHIRYYQNSRSRARMRMDLMKKGIDREVIERCLEEELTASQTDLIRELLRKKGYDASSATREEQAKMYRFLAGRGFSGSEIRQAMDAVDE